MSRWFAVATGWKWPRLAAMSSVMVLLFFVAPGYAAAETIVEARYGAPTERYGHFALGRPHEYAMLEVRTDAGRRLSLELPSTEVFEDLAPRRVRLSAHGPWELLTIVAHRETGARLVLIGLEKDTLSMVAQGPAIGAPMRWLNPVGAIDLDGSGDAEIIAVTTPHIGGTLRVYRREGRSLREVAALRGFSNHVYRSEALDLSMPWRSGTHTLLLVPDDTRRYLRMVMLRDHDTLVEVGRCRLPAPVTGEVRNAGAGWVEMRLGERVHRFHLRDCDPS